MADDTNTGSSKPIGRLERTEPLLVGYKTARDLLAKARRGLERYKRDPMSADGTDLLSDLILTAHSLCEWVYEHHFQPSDVERRVRDDFNIWRNQQIEACEDIAWLDELANAFKHRALDRPGALRVESVKEGTIIYEIEPGFERLMLDSLATFGGIQNVGPIVDNDEIVGFRIHHTAHIAHLSQDEGEHKRILWCYVIDVVNRSLTHWECVINERERRTDS